MYRQGVSGKGSAKEGRSTLDVVAPSHGMGSRAEEKGQTSWAAAIIALCPLAGTQCDLPSLSPAVTGRAAFIALSTAMDCILTLWSWNQHFLPYVALVRYFVCCIHSTEKNKLIPALNTHSKSCPRWPNPLLQGPISWKSHPKPHELECPQHMDLGTVSICPVTMA